MPLAGVFHARYSLVIGGESEPNGRPAAPAIDNGIAGRGRVQIPNSSGAAERASRCHGTETVRVTPVRRETVETGVRWREHSS